MGSDDAHSPEPSGPAPSPIISEVLERCRFADTGPLVCAVSGGADSSALLILAAATGREVRVVHVDHGLRSSGPSEARRVRELAASVGAECEVHILGVLDGPNLEARARAARRSVLPEGALTGHTADDQAETVLLQLLRGGALDALAAMSSERRPLLQLRRDDTERVCSSVGYTPVEDPSNSAPRFARNRIRHEVLPLLASVMGRDPVPLLARAARIAGDERDLLEELAASIDPHDAAALAAAPVPLARRAVRRWLRTEHPPDFAAVDRVLELARGERKATEISGGRRVQRSKGRLEVVEAKSTGAADSG